MKPLRVLLINPYIYDFSAYSFWSSPLGLLYLGSILRSNGFQVHLIDCLAVVEAKRKPDGRAPFVRATVKKPAALTAIPRRYRRYGISPEALLHQLKAVEAPDLVLVTSIMTYWYPGALEAVDLARQTYPEAKIVLGGIYPSLCYNHAAKEAKNADLVVKNSDLPLFFSFLEEVLAVTLPHAPSVHDLSALPLPCLDLYDTVPFVPLLTSVGCAYSCTYCATPFLHPRPSHRSPQGVLAEILHWQSRGVRRFVLYDDSFLFPGHGHARDFLAALSRLSPPVEIYNPNALNASFLDAPTARLLFRAGFKEVRLGLESIDPSLQRSTGGKVTTKTFEAALSFLLEAGFSPHQVGVYVLAGLPFQPHQTVRAAIDYACALGLHVHLAEYTPIPGTPLFEQFKASARYPVEKEPLFQNNALFPFAWEGFTEEDLQQLKVYLRERNPRQSRPGRAPGPHNR